MLDKRAVKSGWSTGTGDILSILDDAGDPRVFLTKYDHLTIGNIHAHFTIYKAHEGRQLHNSAQLAECLLASIVPKTAEIVLAESHLWKSHRK